LQDASLSCWGANDKGQLGDSTTKDRPFPGLVFGAFDLVEVAVGDAHVCGRFKDNLVKCWGDGSTGQLGDGETETRPVPVLAKF
jgi:alpha-tubulin suppressor-like RCC1 family protein